MSENKEILTEMKHYFKVSSVEAVAKKLGYKESTASTWRSKGISDAAINKFNLMKSNNLVSNNKVIRDAVEPTEPNKDMVKDDTLYTYKRLKITDEDLLKDVYVVTRLSIEASAGDGIENFTVEETGRILLNKELFRSPARQESLRIIQVKGDSMEPTILDGSHIVIDLSQTESVDSIYSINIDGQIKVKRLQFNLDGTISICSDNQKYKEQIYDPKESQIYFKILGKKILSIQ